MAKEAGGVDKLIRAIEKAAFQKGAGAGAVGALAVGGVAVAAKRSWDTRKARAEEAKEQLKAKVQGSAEPKE
jgi:hypothetical protein